MARCVRLKVRRTGGDVSDVPVATPQKSETARKKGRGLRTPLGGQVRRWPQKPPLFPFRGFSFLESLTRFESGGATLQRAR